MEEAARLFALPSLEAPPALLSFGVRKRLQGAIYSILKKKIYILDEADSGLSYADYALLLRELGRRGAALIVISHDRVLQDMPCHRILTMEKGRISRMEEPEAPEGESLL